MQNRSARVYRALPTTSQSQSSHRRCHTARLSVTTVSNPPALRCSASTAWQRSCRVPVAARSGSRDVQMTTSLSIRRVLPGAPTRTVSSVTRSLRCRTDLCCGGRSKLVAAANARSTPLSIVRISR